MDLSERFWSKVDRRGPDECWLWTASTRSGYGQIWDGDTLRRAHRLAYELTHGAIPTGLAVCHRCDNRGCCNPAHLWLGTQAENISDCVAKQRQRHKPRAALTPAQWRVRALMLGGCETAEIARIMGAAEGTVRIHRAAVLADANARTSAQLLARRIAELEVELAQLRPADFLLRQARAA